MRPLTRESRRSGPPRRFISALGVRTNLRLCSLDVKSGLIQS
jgi:hypothetical protein